MSDETKFKRIMRRREVEEFTGYRTTQLYEHIKRGDFPAPIRLTESGAALGWLSEELEAWRASRIAARDAANARESASENARESA
jgi:predicted DNA-binding transcriptional regulator AlpA